LFALFFFSADWFVNPTSRSPTFDFWILDKKYLLDFFSTFPVKGSRPKQKEDRANTNEIWKIGNFIFATFFLSKWINLCGWFDYVSDRSKNYQISF